mmetsp:Transcript_112908/g.224734  ORF Transcript_112908/g.224734 Transcript_112908/m.224734 type:complete len:257 (-) Transcript_112908:2963-3733(-)
MGRQMPPWFSVLQPDLLPLLPECVIHENVPTGIFGLPLKHPLCDLEHLKAVLEILPILLHVPLLNEGLLALRIQKGHQKAEHNEKHRVQCCRESFAPGRVWMYHLHVLYHIPGQHREGSKERGVPHRAGSAFTALLERQNLTLLKLGEEETFGHPPFRNVPEPRRAAIPENKMQTSVLDGNVSCATGRLHLVYNLDHQAHQTLHDRARRNRSAGVLKVLCTQPRIRIWIQNIRESSEDTVVLQIWHYQGHALDQGA